MLTKRLVINVSREAIKANHQFRGASNPLLPGLHLINVPISKDKFVLEKFCLVTSRPDKEMSR